jgi:pimeloyl-ACP methyl ester carboxylesterase
MALFNIITDRVVAWGKREEEERLTGRQENRRTLSEWLAVFIDVIVVIVLLAITICLTGTLSLRIRDATLQVPGERIFVDGNKYQVHVNCIGNATYDSAGKKNPTFLIEAGEYPFESTLDDFISSAYRNGTIDRYCYWDRPGFSFSDNAPSPLSAGMAASALSEALSQSDELGPWILVSAGVGGIYSRIFSSRAGNIRGMILIDTLHEDLLYTIGRPGQGFLLWAWGIISPLGLDRTPAAVFKGRTREDRVYGRAAYQGGKFIKAKLQENLVADSLTKNEIIQARNIQNKKTPLVVISSGIEVRKDNTWNKMQTDLTKLTDNLKSHDIVSGAPHEVWHTLEGRRVIEKRLGQLART